MASCPGQPSSGTPANPHPHLSAAALSALSLLGSVGYQHPSAIAAVQGDGYHQHLISSPRNTELSSRQQGGGATDPVPGSADPFRAAAAAAAAAFISPQTLLSFQHSPRVGGVPSSPHQAPPPTHHSHHLYAMPEFKTEPMLGRNFSLSPLSALGVRAMAAAAASGVCPMPVTAAAAAAAVNSKRPRGEKKPIPEEQKDDKYFERRKRNNQAAKKSRDARKIREDQIALRATMLEHENAILRAQLITLREEAQSLRHLLVHKPKSSNMTNADAAAVAAAVRNDLLVDMVHQHHRAAAAAAAVAAVATSTT